MFSVSVTPLNMHLENNQWNYIDHEICPDIDQLLNRYDIGNNGSNYYLCMFYQSQFISECQQKYDRINCSF